METIIERYKRKISGVLTCMDRMLITGTLPELSNHRSMTSYLFNHKILMIDYSKFAEPYRKQIRLNAENIAKDNNITIEFVSKSSVRKEEIISKIIEKRGSHPGLVHIISAMEKCPTYKPWHNKQSGKNYLLPDTGLCLTYYFYFIDEQLGLVFFRVPTWAPFTVQTYINGHNWLATKLTEFGIKYEMIDNAFVKIEDWEKAQIIVESFTVKELHEKLNSFASKYCPVYKEFHQLYHWSLTQCECSTDIVFSRQDDLQSIYSKIVQTAVHTVKPEHISSFLGKKLSQLYEGEVGNRYQVRIEGTCIKHVMGKNSIKMYDKYGHILRIETTSYDISEFKHYREVRHRDGTCTDKVAAMRKTIYSLPALFGIMQASNRRYIEFISAIEDDKVGKEKLDKITKKVTDKERNYRGFNLFDKEDEIILQTIARGEFNISGFRAKHLKKYCGKSSSKISRILKRLHVHKLIKKPGKTYKYYLTSLGKEVIMLGEKLKNLVVIPQLNMTKLA